jgi:cation transport ATPase
MKRTASFVFIEKRCQLIIEFGLFVTVRVFPCVLKLACPFTTCCPAGRAKSVLALKKNKVIMETTSFAIMKSRLLRDLFAFI